MGNSSNNSSPVLITPREDAADKNAVVSAETEALLKEFRDGKALPMSMKAIFLLNWERMKT